MTKRVQLGFDGRLNRVRVMRATCLTQRGNVIDIDTKQNRIHKAISLIS